VQQPIEVTIVFQGGGAKFFGHLAALETLAALRTSNEVRIRGCAGTSAGAIAAVLLSTGQDPSVLRERLVRFGRQHLPQLPSRFPLWRLALQAWKGAPLADEHVLRDFLQGVLGADWADKTLAQLPIPVRLVATDLRYGEKRVFTDKENIRIIDALADSCALPVYFRNFKHSSGVVDGGICSNLPGEEIMELAEDSEILGFSFKPISSRSSNENPVGLIGYFHSLLSAAIDNSVAESTRRLKEFGAGICEIDATINTFEFGRALLEMENTGPEYRQIKDQSANWLRNELHRRRFYRQSVIPVDDQISSKLKRLMNILYQMHVENMENAVFVIELFVIECVCSSIAAEAVHAFGNGDEVSQTIVVKPTDQPLSSLSLGLGLAKWHLYDTRMTYRVTDRETGSQVPFRTVPVVVELEEGSGVLWRFCLFFFNPPLACGKSYEVRCSVRVQSTLSRINAGEPIDWFTYTSMQARIIKKLELIAHVPDTVDALEVYDFVKRLNELPIRHWARRPEARQKLVPALKIGSDGDGRHHRAFCRSMCLYTENLEVGHTAGMLFRQAR